MKIKEFKYLELKDDEKGIDTFIKDSCKNERVDVYVDYRDLEDLEGLVKECDTKWEFCDKLYMCYSDQISEDLWAIVRGIANELKDKYECYDVSDELFNYIEERVWDLVPVDLPYSTFLERKVRVNLFVTYNNSHDVWEEPYDYTTLSKFLTNLGYKKPKTLLKMCEKNNYTGDDKFLKSLQEEFLNAFPNQANYLCFIGEVTIEDYYDISLSIDKYILVPKDTTCGFVDPYNGGGSILGIELPSEYKIRTSNITHMLLEHSKDKYTVDDIYGLVSEAYKNLKVL